jgi:hypothetical protein
MLEPVCPSMTGDRASKMRMKFYFTGISSSDIFRNVN